MMIRATGALAISAGVVACDPADEASPAREDSFAEQAELGGGPAPAYKDNEYACPIWQCGFNSAEINGTSLREINLDGEPNSAGLQLVSVVPPATSLLAGYSELDVEDDALVLRRPNAPNDYVTGAALVGTELVLKGDGLLDLPVTVVIAGHEAVKPWAKGAPAVDAYSFLVLDLDGLLKNAKNVCVGDLTDNFARATTVLGGETYDLDAKTVHGGKDRWLTIACAGSAVAKLKMLGYGPQQSKTTVEQRQATLKMITADYCGNGFSYTANGTPVIWENLAGTVHVAGDSWGVEAVWTPKGALCLDGGRLPGIKVACGLPSCDSYDLGDGEWISYLPTYKLAL